LRSVICRAFSGQGSLGFEDRVDPHHDDRSPQWIYPNLTDPGTSCHGFVSRHDWNRRGSTALRCGPRFRTNPPGAPRLRSAHLVGPLSAPPRERKARTAAPEVPSTKETPLAGSRIAFSYLATGADAPTPFQPAPRSVLTGDLLAAGSATLERWDPGSPSRDTRYSLFKFNFSS
jgi:hypothetical protein